MATEEASKQDLKQDLSNRRLSPDEAAELVALVDIRSPAAATIAIDFISAPGHAQLPATESSAGNKGEAAAAKSDEAGAEAASESIPALSSPRKFEAADPEALGGSSKTGDYQVHEAIAEDAPAPGQGSESSPSGDPPVTLTHKTFGSGKECRNYFSKILKSFPLSCNLGKPQHDMLKELLLKGHPDPSKKIGSGIEAFQIREIIKNGEDSLCFFVIRTDGTAEDFSTLKCIAKLFPSYDPWEHFPDQRFNNSGAGQRSFRGRGRANFRGRSGFQGRGQSSRGGRGQE